MTIEGKSCTNSSINVVFYVSSGEGGSNVTNNVQYNIHLSNFDPALLDVLRKLTPNQDISDDLFNQFISSLPQVRY